MSEDHTDANGAASPPADVMAELDGLSGWSRIAGGGFSTVYRAVEGDLRRDVAVKVLDAELDGVTRRRFLRETETLGRLSQHPNVITVHRAGVSGSGRGWIVMEYAAGGSLHGLLAGGPFSVERTCDVVRGLAGALDEAHRLGLVHRDVKPANVFVTAFGEVVLGDFGVARMIASESPLTIDSVAPPLTPAYSPPEVLRGEPGDATVDVWMLAATAAHLLVGEPPFDWSPPPVDDRAAVAHVAALTDRLSAAGLGAAGLEVFRRAFSIEPSERPTSCSEFSRDLDLALARDGPVTPADATVAPDDDAEAVDWDDRLNTGGRRGRSMAVAASVLLCVVTLVALVLWNRGTGDDTEVAADTAADAARDGWFWVPGDGAAVRVRASDLAIIDRASVPSRVWLPTEAGAVGQQLEIDPVALRLADDSPTLERVLLPPSGESTSTTALAASPSGRYAWYHEQERVDLDRLDPGDVLVESPERLLLVDFDAGEVIHIEDLPAGSGVDTLWDPLVMDDAALLLWQKDPDSFAPQLTRLERDGTASSSLDAPVTGNLVAAGDTIWVAGRDGVGTVDADRPRVTEVGPATRQVDADRVGQLRPIGLSDGSVATGGHDSSLLAVRITHPDGSTSDHVHEWEGGEAPVLAYLDGVATDDMLWWPTEDFGSLFRLDTATGEFSRVELPEWAPTNDVGWELTTSAGGVVAQRSDIADFVDEQGEVTTIGAVLAERHWLYGSSDISPERQAVLASDREDGRWMTVSGDGRRVVRDPGERLLDLKVVDADAWGLTTGGALIRFPMNGTGAPTTVIDGGLSGYLGIGDGLLVAADRDQQVINVVRTSDGRVVDRVTLDPDAGQMITPSPDLHVAAGSVWWTAQPSGVHRVDLEDRTASTLEVGEPVTSVVEVDGEAWGATPTALVRLEPSVGGIERIDIPGATQGFAVARESEGRILWISTRDFLAASMDPTGPMALSTFRLPESTVALTVLDGYIWVNDGDTLRRLSGTDGTESAALEVEGAYVVRSGGGAVWTISDTELIRVDPDTATIDQRWPLEE